MRNYKTYEKKYIGDSDVASLVVRSYDKTQILNFGGDNSYYAYIVDDKAIIPTHYKLVGTFDSWIRLYDDYTCTLHLRGDSINIYQCGCYGIIIQVY